MTLDYFLPEAWAEQGTKTKKKGAKEELARDRHGRRHCGRQSEEQSAPVW
jgi:hypothetical protein